jgi:hypothetical protein
MLKMKSFNRKGRKKLIHKYAKNFGLSSLRTLRLLSVLCG